MINRYIEYIKDNPNKLWFKARWYGWGWVPASWKGWAAIIVFIAILVSNAFYFESKNVNQNPSTYDLGLFFGVTIVSVSLLFLICFMKGEKPSWNWGDPRKKDITKKDL